MVVDTMKVLFACLVNELMDAKEMVFQAWVYERVPLNLQMAGILRMSGTNFHHS